MDGESRAPTPSYTTLPFLAEPPASLLEGLTRRFPRVGEDVWRSRMAAGRVTFDDGEEITPATPYRPGRRVRYFREVAEEPEVPFHEEILYRDEELLVADKPPFLPVVPGGPYVNECLVYRLRRRTGEEDLVALHRLDRETAGLVVCSLRRRHRGLYGRLFMEGRVEKEYLAVARLGAAEPGVRAWTVENRLERGEPWFRMRTVAGKPNARTRIDLDERCEGLGLFRLRPETGKKHQLRVHMSGLGMPILHDRYYPDLEPERPDDFTRPLQLLASGLRFRDPLSGRELVFKSRQRLTWPP